MVKAQTSSELDGIGQRIRKARRERGLTQAELAGSWFTRSYISAIERKRVRPSLKALHIFAGRLDLPAASLLGDIGAAAAPSEALLSEQQPGFYLDRAGWLIGSLPSGAAIEQLAMALLQDALAAGNLSPGHKYRLFFLRALARTHRNDLAAALSDAAQAISLAEQLAADQQALLRGENLLGWIHYEQLAGTGHDALRRKIEFEYVEVLRARVSTGRPVSITGALTRSAARTTDPDGWVNAA